MVPSALPVLGPFAFLCHQKWDSASKLPLIPRQIPILMLSGLRDEVVPAEHMQGLWEIVKSREADSPAGTPARKFSITSSILSTSKSPEQPAVTARVEDVRMLSKFVQFEYGAHSESYYIFASRRNA